MLAVIGTTSQYTPRILRNFSATGQTQLVLGHCVGISTYWIVSCATIRSEDDDADVSCVARGWCSLSCSRSSDGRAHVIYVVHTTSRHAAARNILARVARETLARIDASSRVRSARGGRRRCVRARASPRSHAAPRARATTGYVQGVQEDRLLHLAGTAKRIVRMERGVGEFAVEGDAGRVDRAERGAAGLARHASATGDVRSRAAGDDDLDGLARRVAGAYRIAEYRTVDQDAAFGVRQIATSPSRRSRRAPTTAPPPRPCVDYLGAVLVRLTDRRIESAVREEGRRGACAGTGADLRVAPPSRVRRGTPERGGQPALLQRLLDVLAQAATCNDRPPALRAHRRADGAHHEVAERTIPRPRDRERLRAGYIAGLARSALRRRVAAHVRARPPSPGYSCRRGRPPLGSTSSTR
jgi:uncharacterized membrane protein